jgi:hypothetical protein
MKDLDVHWKVMFVDAVCVQEAELNLQRILH